MSKTDNLKKVEHFKEPIKKNSLTKFELDNKRRNSTSGIESDLIESNNDIFVNSPFYLKFGKKQIYEEFEIFSKTNQSEHSSDDEKEGETKIRKKERELRKKYDVSYRIIRSKSSQIKKPKEFDSVKEEKVDEENETDLKTNEKLLLLNDKIFFECIDKNEEYLDSKYNAPLLTSCKSSKCLNVMDTVLEDYIEENVGQKEEDNEIKPLRKIKFVVDSKEDQQFGTNNNPHHLNIFDYVNDPIKEEGKDEEGEQDDQIYSLHKYNTHNFHIIKYQDSLDKSELNKEEPILHTNFITEKIVEEKDENKDQDEIIMNPISKRKLLILINF